MDDDLSDLQAAGLDLELDAELVVWLTKAEPQVLRSQFGLRWLSLQRGVTCQEQAPVGDVLEGDGRLSMAALAVLIDSALGTAGVAAGPYQAAVTTSLRCDLVSTLPTPAGVVTCEATTLHADTGSGFVTGVLRDTSGVVVGHSTIRTLTVPLRGGRRSEPPAGAAPGGAPPSTGGPEGDGSAAESEGGAAEESAASAGAEPGAVRDLDRRGTAGTPVDRLLGVQSIEAGEGASVLHAAGRSSLVNGMRNLHGGVAAGLGHRGARHAAQSVLAGDGGLTDLALEVDYLRPLEIGEECSVHASVVSRSRRFAWVHARVLKADGRLATHVRAMFAIEQPGA